MLRVWCGLALDALGRAREEIDAINVYPVADGDTGTNLYLTLESAARALDAAFTGHEPGHPTPAQAARAMAHGALIGARGNSGTILAQLLRGLSRTLPGEEDDAGDDATMPGAGAAPGRVLATALRRAAEAAHAAVAHPVEGTVLTVAAAAAAAAGRAGDAAEHDCGAVARAAYEAARDALEATPGQLAVLGRAGVVDAGGQGLVVLLATLVEAVTGEAPAGHRDRPPRPRTARPGTATHPAGPGHPERPAPAEPDAGPAPDAPDTSCARHGLAGRAAPAAPAPHAPVDAGCGGDDGAGGGPAYEVIYLLEAEEAAVERLRERLDGLGDSLVVGGGDGLWSVHVHVDDAGAAVEAGVVAGRPHRIRITHLGAGQAPPVPESAPHTPRERAPRAVVAVVPGDGLAALCAEAGATPVLARPGEPPASGELVAAIQRTHADEVVLLPNDAALHHTAAAAAEQARTTSSARVSVIPTRAVVQGLAALAVHAPDRRFDEDVVAMTAAAGATRYAELTVAEHRSWTTAGVCRAGDVLGLIDGDVAVIDADLTTAATAVLDRMLSSGGELVTLVTATTTPRTLTDHLEKHVRENHLAVDTVTYSGGHPAPLLLVGVE